MAQVIGAPARFEEEPNLPEIEWGGKRFQTFAIQLVPFPQWADPTLIGLVCQTMAVKPGDRPTLDYLLDTARRQVEAPAGDDPREQDDAVSRFWMDIVYNAPTYE